MKPIVFAFQHIYVMRNILSFILIKNVDVNFNSLKLTLLFMQPLRGITYFLKLTLTLIDTESEKHSILPRHQVWNLGLSSQIFTKNA